MFIDVVSKSPPDNRIQFDNISEMVKYSEENGEDNLLLIDNLGAYWILSSYRSHGLLRDCLISLSDFSILTQPQIDCDCMPFEYVKHAVSILVANEN